MSLCTYHKMCVFFQERNGEKKMKTAHRVFQKMIMVYLIFFSVCLIKYSPCIQSMFEKEKCVQNLFTMQFKNIGVYPMKCSADLKHIHRVFRNIFDMSLKSVQRLKNIHHIFQKYSSAFVKCSACIRKMSRVYLRNVQFVFEKHVNMYFF